MMNVMASRLIMCPSECPDCGPLEDSNMTYDLKRLFKCKKCHIVIWDSTEEMLTAYHEDKKRWKEMCQKLTIEAEAKQ